MEAKSEQEIQHPIVETLNEWFDLKTQLVKAEEVFRQWKSNIHFENEVIRLKELFSKKCVELNSYFNKIVK